METSSTIGCTGWAPFLLVPSPRTRTRRSSSGKQHPRKWEGSLRRCLCTIKSISLPFKTTSRYKRHINQSNITYQKKTLYHTHLSAIQIPILPIIPIKPQWTGIFIFWISFFCIWFGSFSKLFFCFVLILGSLANQNRWLLNDRRREKHIQWYRSKILFYPFTFCCRFSSYI